MKSTRMHRRLYRDHLFSTTRLISSNLAKQPVLLSVSALIVLGAIILSVIVPSSSALTNNGSITTFGSPLTENSNSLANSGTANAWSDNSTIPGWYAQFTTTTNPTTYRAGTGSDNAGAIYSFGSTASSERAMGGVGSNTTGDIFWAARFINNTGSPISSLDISYVGEQWRNGGNTSPQQLDFQYQVAPAGTITDANTPTTGWVDFDLLDFVSPITGATAAALDGNAAANRTAKSGTITLTVSPGQEVWLRWRDLNDAGNDHGLAVDDLSVTAQGGGGVNLSINDVTVTEGNSGPVTASFTVSLSSNVHSGVTFDISTQDNSATTLDNDYVGKTLLTQFIPSGASTYTFDVTVNGDLTFEPNETFFVNVTNVSGATVSDGQGVGTINNDDCPPAADVVISQVYGGGGNAGAPYQNDFIELFNQGSTAVNLSGWSVQYNSPTGGGTWQVTALSGSIAPGGYYLIHEAAGNSCSGSPCGVPLPAPDASGTIAMGATGGKVALLSSTVPFNGSCPTCAVDLVGYGAANCFEGSSSTAVTANTTAALRKRGGCFDSNNNGVDFSVGDPNPRNTTSPTNNCLPTSLAIHDIQGNGAASPYAGQFVSTSGIVTGLKSNGFFMQEPEANYDIYPETSEGIFVFTSAAPTVVVGNAVAVLGTATEFFNLTQVESTLPGDVTVMSTVTPPLPVVLTPLILNPAGTPDQLERFEGMRLHADMLVSVAPSNEFGETFTVLFGVARPLREAGIEFGLPVPPDPTSGFPDCCIPIWDKNPERIMIDSDGLAGSSPIPVTSNVTFTNVTGPLDFTFGNYKIDPETPPTTSANMSAVPVPTPVAGEFTVAGYNIENFNNGATQRQKAALAIRDVLHLPDVIGHVEIFELSGLQALAAEVEAISGVHYEARLIEGDGNSGDADQDVGFLIKTSRVQIDSVTQEELAGCNGTAANCNTYIDPTTGNPALLNDRPPLVLRATVDPSSVDPQPVIIVVNHLRSFIDIEGVSGEGERVRAKRKAQGEFLANLLQSLQVGNPTTPVISVGDYNAYQFNDGYTDPIATIKGNPTSDDEVVVDASPDVVSPDFINLIDSLPSDQRYSFIFEGTPQALDHVIINTVATSYLTRFAIARNNSDFPEVPAALFASNASRPERNSDHDMPMAYFLFPPDQDNDGVPDATDNCVTTANPDQANNDGDAFGDVCDPDDDNDGVLDVNDNCQFTANTDQANNDGDAEGDACDADDDNDGVLDVNDNCPFTANTDQANNDGDAEGDACDADDDNDGVLDVNDNCPFTANTDQANNDGDAEGDACDADDDNDGVLDVNDNCPFTANTDQANNDGDAQGDVCDLDDDNDGIPDTTDNCPFVANSGQANNDGDAQGDVCDPDDDNDGVPDTTDNCPFTANTNQANNDGDAQGDACDPDDDNDGVPDTTDNCPFTYNPDQTDTDHDNVGDACTGFQFPAGGAFVIGNNVNLTGGATVYFWGSQWSQNNPMSGGSGPNSFKGFEGSNASPTCGGSWTSSPGARSTPPATVPQYMAVIVASSVQKSGSTISGNIQKIVIVKTNPGYGPSPGQTGTGTVVAVICVSGSSASLHFERGSERLLQWLADADRNKSLPAVFFN